jgi:hypothetical protein
MLVINSHYQLKRMSVMSEKTLSHKKYSEGSFFVPLLFIFVFIYFLISSETTIEIPLKNDFATEKTNQLISNVYSPSVQYWETEIIKWSEVWGLDPNLIATVIQIESCGDPSVVSGAGAIGLFQVMPYHFEDAEDPYAVEINSMRGLAYLSKASLSYESLKLIFASYNGGIYGASKQEVQWPTETKRYVYWGMNIYNDAISNSPNKNVLNEWFENGGNRLCNQAMDTLSLSP